LELKDLLLAVFLGLFLLVSLLVLLRKPLGLLFRLVGNTLLGFAALGLVRSTAALTGITLGLNLFNALTVGILGLPGFLLLLLTQWVLT